MNVLADVSLLDDDGTKVLGKTDRKSAGGREVSDTLDLSDGAAFLADGYLAAEVDRIETDGTVCGAHDHLRMEPMRNVVMHSLNR